MTNIMFKKVRKDKGKGKFVCESKSNSSNTLRVRVSLCPPKK